MKPPSFMMLTPNGRFQTNTKICLSISSHHPEHWQPSWSVRTALTALAAFMPTPGNGAIGSLDTPEVERRKLASESRSFIPSFGSPERQALSAEMHRCMLAVEEKALAGGAGPCEVGAPDPPGNGSAEEARGSEPPEKPSGARPPCEEDSTGKDAASSPQEQPSGPSGQPPSPATAPPPPLSAALPDPDAPDAAAMPPHGGGAPGSHARRCESEDKGLTWLACALSVAIAALLLRKLFAYMDAPIDELQHL
uniref:Ubiquitin-conjugating enzyme E2 J1 n=1 Tax=Tetraselmis sp. GSL018 TaxID=582737 RepID=A0A061QRV0_9CHLO